MGDYEIGHEVKPGDYFYSQVGLLYGAFGGNVEFRLYLRVQGETEWQFVPPGVQDTYDYVLKSMVILLPAEYSGKKVDLSLRVTGIETTFQAWAVWVEAKLIR